jgi:hypothetical protein
MRIALDEMTPGPLATSFATLSDPRVDRTKKHLLLDIVLIAICAVTRTHRPTAY